MRTDGKCRRHDALQHKHQLNVLRIKRPKMRVEMSQAGQCCRSERKAGHALIAVSMMGTSMKVNGGLKLA